MWIRSPRVSLFSYFGKHNKIRTYNSVMSMSNEMINWKNLSKIKARQVHSTVDQSDIKKHAESVNIWWDLNGQIKPLHSYNLIRVPFVQDGLVNSTIKDAPVPLQGKSILDIGCGGGILSEDLAKLGASVTGVDAGEDLIRVAQEHARSNSKLGDNIPTYICSTIEEHAESHKNHYDAVVASEVIEHVNEKELFVKSCVEVLKPGGKIFFTTPSKTRISQFLTIFVIERVLRVIPRGTHQYEKFMTPTELEAMLKRNNCHVELTRGITYNPFANRWSFIDSQKLMFAMQAVKQA